MLFSQLIYSIHLDVIVLACRRQCEYIVSNIIGEKSGQYIKISFSTGNFMNIVKQSFVCD